MISATAIFKNDPSFLRITQRLLYHISMQELKTTINDTGNPVITGGSGCSVE